MLIFDKQYIYSFVKDILTTDSPTGFTKNAMNKAEGYATGLGYNFYRTVKGNGVIEIPGKPGSNTVGICAHIDTLGLMIRTINNDGALAFTRVGAPALPTLDGEYCKIYTRGGKSFTGTILLKNPSSHVNHDAHKAERSEDNMYVRLDNIVKTKKDVEALGISVGDYICIDPKTVITETDFIKSRFLDDKLSLGVIFGVLKYLKDNNITPKYNLKALISTYEEVGHGMAFIPDDITDLLAVDMGCVGTGLSCTEYDVSICAKDSSGPYNYDFTSELITIARENKLRFAVDVYPYYSSDASAAVRAGNDVRCALIGPGVHASHGMERSHYEAVYNTMKLVFLYLT